MRLFALLVAIVTLALFLTAVYAQRSAMANRSGAHAAHPIASIGDIFRGY